MCFLKKMMYGEGLTHGQTAYVLVIFKYDPNRYPLFLSLVVMPSQIVFIVGISTTYVV